MRSFGIIFVVLLIAIIYSCRKDPEIITVNNAAGENTYQPVIPSGWPAPVYNFENNSVTEPGFTLGRHLFYEPLLSEDTSISCGSCHQQVFAFTNGPDHATSHGVHDLKGKRNTPALFNLNWAYQLMWDGAVSNLEFQPLAPLQNPLELNLNITSAISRLSANTKYKALFKDAFGDTVVNSQRILKSFAQFMGLMVSYNSKYDKVKRGDDNFTTAENNGYIIYKNNCAMCHAEPLFSDYSFRNKGLPVNTYQDSGKYLISHDPADMFKFKVPSLRNLTYTAPYMHDGRFATLDNVLDFFTGGVSATPNLDYYMSIPHSFTQQQRNDLLSFLTTLNDEKFVSDPRFKEIH